MDSTTRGVIEGEDIWAFNIEPEDFSFVEDREPNNLSFLETMETDGMDINDEGPTMGPLATTVSGV